jgi:hypothetical protein
LAGVATPGELLRDPKITRFDIGQHVELADFQFVEARILTGGWKLREQEAGPLYKEVIDWTGGHPYLTQKLCRLIAESPRDSWPRAELENLVRLTFMQDSGRGDYNLAFVRDMLLKRAPHPESLLTVLQTYQSVYKSKPRVEDDEQSLVKCHLKLTGIVQRQQDWLMVRNRIYRKVFDGRWIQQHMPLQRAELASSGSRETSHAL